MDTVSLPRLYALRALYLLVVVGLGLLVLPQLPRVASISLEGSIIDCMLVAFWALCLLGLRYPLQMIPVLLWEFAWKCSWFALVALPRWRSGHLDDDFVANAWACSLVVLIPVVMPWGHVARCYLRAPAAPWTRAARAALAVDAA